MAQGFGIAFFACWVVLALGGITIGIIISVAAWKAMRAGESIAASMKEISQTLKIDPNITIVESDNKDSM